MVPYTYLLYYLLALSWYIVISGVAAGRASFLSQTLNNSSTDNEPIQQSRILTVDDIFLYSQAFIAEMGVSSQSCNAVKGKQVRPVVTLSYAQTIDASIAPADRCRWEISSNSSFRLLHSLRSIHDGILVGINTLRLDQPRLNVRNPLHPTHLLRQPRPIVIDTDLSFVQLPEDDLRLDYRPLLCYCHDERSPIDMPERVIQARQRLLGSKGELVVCPRAESGEKRVDLTACLLRLKSDYAISSLLLEGGARMIQSFLDEDLVDQVVVTIKPWYYGGYRALTRQLRHPLRLMRRQVASSDDDIILYGLVEQDNIG